MFEDDPGFMPDYNAPISLGEQFQALQGLGTQAVNFVSGAVRMVPGFLSDVRESFRPENQPTVAPSDPTNPVQTSLNLATEAEVAENLLSDKVATGTETVLGQFGVPESVSTPIAGLVGAVLTPGFNDLKIAGGAITMPLLGVLSQHPALKGLAKKGIAQTPEYAPGIAKLRAEQELVAERIDKFMAEFAAGTITQKTLRERLSKVKKRADAKFSTLATPDDPDIFEKPKFKVPDPTDPRFKADQHHATTKAMTSAVVQRALDVTDDDDNIVALFNLHKALVGSGMGNVRSGIIDMPGVLHDTAKASKRGADPKLAQHSIMKKSGAGIEIPSEQVKEMFADAETFDQLIDKYIVFANEYLIPQKEIALNRLNQYLANHRETLAPAQRADFDLLVKKLNKANTK